MSKAKFFIEAIRDFKTTGSWVPSQKYLINSITKHVNKHKKMHIVEFGAGEGCVTERIANNMHKDSSLISFEINKKFAGILKDKLKKEKRIKIINDDVKNIKKYLKTQKSNLIISSLPMGNFHKTEVNNIIDI